MQIFLQLALYALQKHLQAILLHEGDVKQSKTLCPKGFTWSPSCFEVDLMVTNPKQQVIAIVTAFHVETTTP